MIVTGSPPQREIAKEMAKVPETRQPPERDRIIYNTYTGYKVPPVLRAGLNQPSERDRIDGRDRPRDGQGSFRSRSEGYLVLPARAGVNQLCPAPGRHRYGQGFASPQSRIESYMIQVQDRRYRQPSERDRIDGQLCPAPDRNRYGKGTARAHRGIESSLMAKVPPADRIVHDFSWRSPESGGL